MILFPLVVGLLALALLAQLTLVAVEAMREHSFRPHRHPTLRAIAVLTVIELALVIAWVVTQGAT
jgi:hypothetical protein